MKLWSAGGILVESYDNVRPLSCKSALDGIVVLNFDFHGFENMCVPVVFCLFSVMPVAYILPAIALPEPHVCTRLTVQSL